MSFSCVDQQLSLLKDVCVVKCTILVNNLYLMLYIIFLHDLSLRVFIKVGSTRFVYIVLSDCVCMSMCGCKTWEQVATFLVTVA